jgi:hypothetical protein
VALQQVQPTPDTLHLVATPTPPSGISPVSPSRGMHYLLSQCPLDIHFQYFYRTFLLCSCLAIETGDGSRNHVWRRPMSFYAHGIYNSERYCTCRRFDLHTHCLYLTYFMQRLLSKVHAHCVSGEVQATTGRKRVRKSKDQSEHRATVPPTGAGSKHVFCKRHYSYINLVD